MMEFLEINNNQPVNESSVPVLPYDDFLSGNLALLAGHCERHCVMLTGYSRGKGIRLICCIADDNTHKIMVSFSDVSESRKYSSFSFVMPAFEKFERKLHEELGIGYTDHPNLKPLAFPFKSGPGISSYPFFKIESEELHEVGVGPVHAGIIEPGHFRFVCNGEQILNLEIQLGYQNRGIEELFLKKNKLIQRITLAESIAGDSVAGHASAFAYLWEGLAGSTATEELQFVRTIAQEIERIAVHTGDLSALCTDIAYQLGSAVFGRLRTPVINFFQEWCGNRFAKSLIRPGKNIYPFDGKLADKLSKVLDDFEPDFTEIYRDISRLPSALSRFERTGTLSYEQIHQIGAVGMAARMNALSRDIRTSHPYGIYPVIDHKPVIKHHGDVYSRVQIRKEEVIQSIGYLRKLLHEIPVHQDQKEVLMNPQPGTFIVSLVEGWRGEICHTALTNSDGELVLYRIKDPSFHNWLALALAVRNNEISDFPVCNKSFNLSYCGHDL